MTSLYVVVAMRGMHAETLTVTNGLHNALLTVAAVAALAPELRLTLGVSDDNGYTRALQVVDGRWYVTDAYVASKEAA